jgi:methylated-DNA-protein-cysteine methyltransferase-like protein
MARSSGRRDGTGQSAARDAEMQAEPAERIWQVVALIPRGRVATYGQVAALAGMPRHARLVGRTLRDLPQGSRLPWHRVVNASLKISLRPGTGGHEQQRRRLEAEGVSFVGERIPRQFRWEATA